MKEFDYVNHANNLPDCYAKTPDSNNYKILEIERESVSGISADIEAVFNALDIDTATGKTLDMYGEILHQPRGLASDSQYRLMIKNKLTRNVSYGTYKSVVDAMCKTFNCDPSEVLFKEVEGEPCTVELAVLPVDVINSAGLTIQQTVEMVKQLLPAGITLKQYSFEGTFKFAEDDWVATTTEGFASDDGSIQGGYLGTIGHYDNENDLPI